MSTTTYILGFSALMLIASPAQAVILYQQDFENPTGFVNHGVDVSVFTVNQLYGNQPPGFTFAQDFSVETLLITGKQAFGTGYSDPSGKGGNYAIGMLSTIQNDLLGLSFNVGNKKFLNFSLDISSIDVSAGGGPFVAPGAVPVFEFTLYDNPSGTTGLGSGKILSKLQATGTASPRSQFDWTRVGLPLDASGSTNGNVTLRIDLLAGGYAAMDNFVVEASDQPCEITPSAQGCEPKSVPEASSPWALLGFGALGVGALVKRQLHQKSQDHNLN